MFDDNSRMHALLLTSGVIKPIEEKEKKIMRLNVNIVAYKTFTVVI